MLKESGKSGPDIRKVPLTAIKVDPEFYPPSRRRQPLARKWFRQLLKGLKLPAVKVMEVVPKKRGVRKEFLLVDGYGIFQAHQQRAKLHKSGKLREPLSQVELETIEVELVDAPIHKTKNQHLKDKIRQFYEQFPGCSVSSAAKELDCDRNTIRKYAGDLIEEWKKERTKLVEGMRSQGKSSREIMQAVQRTWPSTRGPSQPTISRMVCKKPRSH